MIEPRCPQNSRKLSAITLLLAVLGLPRVAWAQDYEVGAVEETASEGATFNPSLFSGAATYAVAIDLPPGRRGINPTVQLSYSSMNHDRASLVGAGWSLTMPRIRRSVATSVTNLYSDGQFTLDLNGAQETLVGEELEEDSEIGFYIPEVETGGFYRIEHQDDDSWVVTTKDGTRYFFGESEDTRIEHPDDETLIAEWYLERVLDTRGNLVSYTYYEDVDNQVLYPATINYTGHEEDGVVEEGPVTVRFEPFASEDFGDDRPDSFITYRNQFRQEYRYLLEEIAVDVDGYDTPVQRYQLSYASGSNGVKQLLESVQRAGLDLDEESFWLPATEFTYSSEAVAWESDEAYPFPSLTLGGGDNITADFTGDGYIDILQLELSGESWTYRMYAGGRDGFTDVSDEWVVPQVNFQVSSTLSFDLNSDGLADLMDYHYDSGTYSAFVLLNNGDGTFEEIFNDGGTYEEITDYWSVPENFWFNDGGTKFGDLNGDGLLDMLWHGYDAAYESQDGDVWLNTGVNGWEDGNDLFSLPDIDSSESGYEVSDLNGDGLADIWNFNASPPYFYLNQGDGTFVEVSDSFETLPEDSAESMLPLLEAALYNLVDINGDGLTDVYAGGPNAGGYEAEVWIGTGYGWQSKESWDYLGSTNTHGYRLLDLDGDGLSDGGASSCTGGSCSQVFYFREEATSPDLLETIETPQGATITYTYQSSSHFEDEDGNNLNPNLSMVFPVVESVTVDDGLGGLYSTEYVYAGGSTFYSDAYDLRFAGFYQVTAIQDDGVLTRYYFHQGGGEDGSALGEVDDHEALIGQLFREEVYEADETLLQAVVTSYAVDELSEDAAVVLPSSTLTMVFNDDESHVDTAMGYSYDEFGNVTQQTNYGEVVGSDDGSFEDVGADTLLTTTLYAQDTGEGYLVAFPAVTVVSKFSLTLAVTEFYYDDLDRGEVAIGEVTTRREKIDEHPLLGSRWRETHTSYNVYGLRTEAVDANGNVTTYRYDEDGWYFYPEAVVNALGHETLVTYDLAVGQMLEEIDPNGVTTQWEYDSLGRLYGVWVSDAEEQATLNLLESYSYDTSTIPWAVTSQHYYSDDLYGETIAYSDGLGRGVQTKTLYEGGGYLAVDSTYDHRGRLTETTIPYLTEAATYSSPDEDITSTQQTYDALNRLLTTTDAVGTRSQRYENRAVIYTDEEGHEKTLTYDAYGRLVQVDEENEEDVYTTSYTYSPLGALRGMTDALDNQRDFQTDLLGRRTYSSDLYDPTETDEYATWRYRYDAVGNQTTGILPDDSTTTYRYDALNRLQSERTDRALEAATFYTYDDEDFGVGFPSTIRRGQVTTSYTYNERAEVVSITRQVGPKSLTTQYTYDWQGNITTMTYPDGSVATYTYNERGLPESLSFDGEIIISEATYNEVGQLEMLTLGNGVTTTNVYDPDQRFWLTDKWTVSDMETLQSLSYSYDGIGNIEEIIDSSDLDSAKTITYDYDDLSRLVSAVSSGDSTDLGDYDYSYDYDELGNMTLHPVYGDLDYGAIEGANPHSLDGMDGVSWEYDSAGNVTVMADLTLSWSYRNELEAVATSSGDSRYQYDHVGTRVFKQTPDDVTFYAEGGYITRLDGTEEWHLSFGGKPVFYRVDTGAEIVERYLHIDHLGSIVLETGTDAEWVSLIEYNPYGSIRQALTSSEGIEDIDRFDYISKERDRETGLSYFEARYLSTESGRFLSLDPVYINVSREEWMVTPQSQNGYVYSRSNPIVYKDQNGEWARVAIGALAGGVVGVIGQAISDHATGTSANRAEYIGAFVGGAVTGGYLAVNPMGAKFGGALGGAVDNLITQVANPNKPLNKFDVVSAAVQGAAVGKAATLLPNVPGTGIPGITTGKGSMVAVSRQMTTKLENGTISTISSTTAAKILTADIVTSLPGAWLGETVDLVNRPAKSYTVRLGDTLSGVFGSAWKHIADFNRLVDPNKLQVGQELKIPD